MVLSCTEAAPELFREKKVFLEISQNSQENTCARASFLTKLQVEATSGRLFLHVHLMATSGRHASGCNMFYQGFSMLLLKSCNKSYNNFQIYHKEVSTHQLGRYHSFLVEIFVESMNLIQIPK